MTRVLIASLIALATSACAYRPAPTDLVQIVDSPADVRVCTRLGYVSPAIQTNGPFGSALDSMLEATLALGGTHLYVHKLSQDWLNVQGIAYRCGPGQVPERVVIRAKG